MKSGGHRSDRMWPVLVLAFLFLGFAQQANDEIVVYMIGDSTMADKPLDDNPERGWGQMFGMLFDNAVRVENHARNGRSTRSFLAEKLWAPVAEKLRAGDYVFIQFGHNDQSKQKTDHYTSPEDFRTNLMEFVVDTRAKQATPILCTPIVRRRFDKNGMFYDEHGVYPDVVREVARELEVLLIDLHQKSKELIVKLGVEESKAIYLWIEPGAYKSLPDGKRDNTHFSEYGARQIAMLAAEGLSTLDTDLAKRLKPRTAKERADIIVDKNGKGHFTSIREALNSVERRTDQVMILIRNGIYNEKLFITRSHLTLVGEHRDSTRIEYAELRENWTKTRNNRPDGTGEELDWGSAVINIGKGATDITIANLTVHNNYGSLHGNHDHQFTIRGFDATRISLLYCNIISDGGDALALWNRESGMYYHNNCYFEGWVDYVCPRGWCYITESTFFGHNMSASIWHDGSANKNQKLVIRNSSFDGVPDFPLGRHHRDAQFFLINCVFSKNMADRPIYAPKSPNLVPWVWGERHYFHDCHREGGDYAWFADNLETAEGLPKAEEITARWTFDGMWDPEANMPSVLPFSFLPKPEQDAKDVPMRDVQLSWVAGRNAISHNIYIGEGNEPEFRSSLEDTRFDPGLLKPNTTYTWRVDSVTSDEIVKGPVWSFKTGDASRP